MTTNYLELLQKKLVSEMAKAINENVEGTDCEATAEDVFNNLDKLYEESEKEEFGHKTGEKTKFMPKQYKEMVMRLISPTYSILTTVEWHEDHVTASANLFYDRMDTKPIATAKSYKYFERMDSDLTEEEKRSKAELAARGYAESKCLQKFGIGSWFNGEYTLYEDNPDMLKNAPLGGEFKPTVVISEEVPMVSNTPNPLEEAQQLDFFNFGMEGIEKSIPFSEEKPTTTALSYEDALSIKVDVGKFAEYGHNLGNVLEKQPTKLAWIYLNTNKVEIREAIQTIASQNNDIALLLESKNIIF